MSGIVRYGSYVPYFRLTRAAIGAGKGERAVASFDEDSVSMAVEAARDAFRGGPRVDTLVFATTSPPYAEKLNAATVQGALDLPEHVASLELGASSRMGLSGLLLGLYLATAGRAALVCASDVVVGAPGGSRERQGGDGAVAFLTGADSDAVARLLGRASATGNLGALILDESSMLKSMYGKWGQKCLELGAGLKWKLCLTGTPAPNDRIEYANHAVFLDHFPTVNSFLARFFVNRGQTDNRWELKSHALQPFYRALSHWCIFLTNPATYGWHDNCGNIPPIHVHTDHVELTPQQSALIRKLTGKLVVTGLGGITSRSVMGRIAKGNYRGEDVPTNKFTHIKEMVDSPFTISALKHCLPLLREQGVTIVPLSQLVY